MSWQLRREGATTPIPLPSAQAVIDGVKDGEWAASDEVRGPGDTAWRRIETHPQFEEAIGEMEEPELPPVEETHLDMNPLIDVSLVLLVFFMLTTVVAAVSPVKVPDMKYAVEIAKEADSITVMIDKLGATEHVYALRLGDKGPTPDDNNLLTLGELVTRLDKRLADRVKPPEVRIACHADLPRGLVREVTMELHKRQVKGQIRDYTADVNEAKK